MLVIRAHHLLCIQGYVGKGYSKSFTINMNKIVTNLKEDSHVKIISKTDMICTTCPHNIGAGCCKNESTVSFFDHKVLDLLNINDGDEYLYKDILYIIKKKLTYESFKKICSTCKWFPYGYCEKGCFK